MAEYESLKHACEGDMLEMREAIEVPMAVQLDWRRYVLKHPEEQKRFAFILGYRQVMLDRLDRELLEEWGIR